MTGLFTRFVVATFTFSIVWGLFLIPWIIEFVDKNPAVGPVQAAFLYYGLIYLSILMFAYVIVGGLDVHLTRLAFIVLLLYVLVDFYEPPLVVGPDGSISESPGFKASLDYSLGSIILPYLENDWKRVYDAEQFLVPGIIVLLVWLSASPQLLGRALRQI